MSNPEERDLEQALDQLAGFEFFRRARSDNPPRLPDDLSDAALNDHVIDGLEAMEDLRRAQGAMLRSEYLRRALQDFRAAIAVHQEWVVDPVR